MYVLTRAEGHTVGNYTYHHPDMSSISDKEAFGKLISQIHPGAIVLPYSTFQTNGEIMDELLTKWVEVGYTFKPLSDLVQQ